MIHTGDCVDWLQTFGDRSVDHSITDPPYSEHVHENSQTLRGAGKYRPGKMGQIEKRDLGFAHLTPALRKAVARELARITRRWVLVFSDEEGVADWRWDLRGAGLEVVRVCPWIKPNCAPQMTGDRPGAGWEPVIVAHQTNVKRKPTIKRWNGGGHRGVFTHDVPRGPEREHTTEKPIALMLELVELFTDPGELIVDPFAGHGTTGAACIRLGRMFVGCELDEATAALADERLLAERAGSSVSSRRAGQRSIFDVEGVVLAPRPRPCLEPSSMHGYCDQQGGSDY